jgi:hypothetical protein
MEEFPGDPSYEQARRRVLATALAHASRVVVVADDHGARALAGPPFASATDVQSSSDGATSTSEVLVLSLDEPWFTRAAELARRLGRHTLYVLLANSPGDPSPTSCSGLARARPRLRERGFAVVGFHRVFWTPPDSSGAASASRTTRLDRETREVLVECRRRDDLDTIAALEERVGMLSRQLELLADLQVQQARTREAESRRLGRLEELEATVERMERIRSAQARALLVEESKELGHLRQEIAFMKSTRFWRLGERYWALRRWLAERGG